MNLLELAKPNSKSCSAAMAGHSGAGDSGDSDVAFGDVTVAESKPVVRTPPLYRVLLMNDDFTPMDFVIHVLQKFFSKASDEATRIMLEVHHKGAGVCGVFSHEIAETKVHIVNTYSKQNRFPLKATMEKAES